jgi:hypothetical protein
MKKARRKPEDELRPEYKRSDFGTPVRGKYAQRATAAPAAVYPVETYSQARLEELAKADRPTPAESARLAKTVKRRRR